MDKWDWAIILIIGVLSSLILYIIFLRGIHYAKTGKGNPHD